MVIIELLVGTDGRVKDAKVIRSVPLLDQAALDAVKQWVYTPTLLNGVPQEIYLQHYGDVLAEVDATKCDPIRDSRNLVWMEDGPWISCRCGRQWDFWRRAWPSCS